MRSSGRALLERDDELRLLGLAVTDVLGGEGRVAVIEGEAGIGKTEIARAVAERADRAGMTVVGASGHELEEQLGFALARTLLDQAMRRRGADAGRDLAGPARQALRLLDSSAGAVADEGVVLHAFFWLWRDLADAGPVALVVDDAQWADEPSLRALLYLARRVAGAPILLVVAHRPGAATALAHLRGVAHVVLTPAPLTTVAVGELIARELQAVPDPAFTAACHRATGGNPFLAIELLAAVHDADVAPDAAGVRAVEEARPEGLKREIAERLAALPSPARAVAEAAAILLAGGSLRHVAAVAGVDDAAASEAVAVLTRARILHPELPFEFLHPLVRTAVLEGMDGAARSAAHARAARVLHDDRAAADRIAPHLLRSEPGGEPIWVEVLLTAARAALGRAAPDTAYDLCRRALREPPAEGGPRWEVLHELGRAATVVAWEEAPDLLAEAVEAAPDIRARGRSLLLWIHAWGVTGRDTVRLRKLVEDALPDVAAADPALASRLRVKRRHLLPDEELDEEVARDATDADVATFEGRATLIQWAWRQAVAGRCSATYAVGLVRQALAAGPVYDEDDPTTGHQYALAIDVLRLGGQIDEAERMLTTSTRAAAQAGDDYIAAMGMAMAADYALERGALSDAEAEATVCLEVAGRRGPRMLAGYQASGVLAAIALERGDPAAAESAVAIAADPQAPPSLARMASTARAAAMFAGGDVAGAADLALAHGRGPFAATVANPALDHWRDVAADALARQGKHGQARGLVAEALEIATLWGTATARGDACRLAGRHARDRETALARFGSACELLSGSHARLSYGHALADLGAVLRRTHRRSAARERLRESLALAQQCGATALATRVEDELRAAGGRPRRLAQSGRDALTPSELRVCRLAADGLSNREIAHTLFVTLGTVEGHLTASFAKLGISGRSELESALRR